MAKTQPKAAPAFQGAIPVLPAADVAASLKWWTDICVF